MTYCIVKCTTASKEDSINIAKHLLEKKLIACANIIPSITSLYEWEGKFNQNEESIILMKSKEHHFEEIENEIKKVHKYEIPEILCIPIIKGNKDYLNWLDKQTNIMT